MSNSKFQIQHFKLFFLAFWILGFGFALIASEYPAPVNDYVSDYAGLLAPGDKQAIYNMLESLEKQTGIEATVLTIKAISDYNAEDESIEEFATNVFDDWGIGHKKENNGVLILISQNDRKMKIELGEGYGDEYEQVMKDVIDTRMIPYFAKGEFSRGIYEGVEGVVVKITKKVSFFQYYWPHILIGILILVFVFAGINFMKQGKKGWGWTFFVIAGILLVILIKLFGRSRIRPGFGGGSSFGGGASGSW